MWPHAVIHIGVPQQLLIDALGSNHCCAMPGDLCAEIEAACEAAQVPVLHLDSSEEMSRFRKNARGASLLEIGGPRSEVRFTDRGARTTDRGRRTTGSS